jgi:hypothetical protein
MKPMLRRVENSVKPVVVNVHNLRAWEAAARGVPAVLGAKMNAYKAFGMGTLWEVG